MAESWPMSLVVAGYVLTNSLRVLSYLPQIHAVSREVGPARAIALSTWLFWTSANATTAAYASTVVIDTTLAMMSIGNTLGCLAVVFVTLYKRRKYGTAATTRTPRDSGAPAAAFDAAAPLARR